jgi:hypothetical protein
MKGTMITIRADGSTSLMPVDQSPDLETLKDGIGGGYLEAVPGWKQIPFENGKLQPCVAFCDEDGKRKQLPVSKQLPVNERATKLWFAMLQLETPRHQLFNDVLVGSVVILTGDEAFMRSLSDDGD